MSGCTVDITGTPTGASCVSYANCDPYCCTKAETACGRAGGSYPTHNCPSFHTGPECQTVEDCCNWTGMACAYKTCDYGQYPVAPPNCAHCGCLVASGSCTPWTCAQVAASNNNPDVCAGCNTCGGDWDINNDRGLTPWAIVVTGELHLAVGGHLVASGYQLKVGSIRTKTHLLHVRPGTGGRAD